MAETTKTIENVDEDYAEIEVNGTTYESENYTASTEESSSDSTGTDTSSETEDTSDTEETTVTTKGGNIKVIQLNNVTHNVEDMQATTDIDSIETKITAHASAISAIEALIPPQASASNQLADKNYVNSGIQTATANFRGNWATWADVPEDSSEYPADYAGSTVPTVNDYLVVQDATDYGTDYEGTWRFKYTGTWSEAGKSGWEPEYQVNETPLTSEQLASLNSGITKEKLDSIESKLTFDTTPTSGSTQAVTSGGIYNALALKTDQTNGTMTFELSDTVSVDFRRYGSADSYSVSVVINNNGTKTAHPLVDVNGNFLTEVPVKWQSYSYDIDTIGNYLYKNEQTSSQNTLTAKVYTLTSSYLCTMISFKQSATAGMQVAFCAKGILHRFYKWWDSAWSDWEYNGDLSDSTTTIHNTWSASKIASELLAIDSVASSKTITDTNSAVTPGLWITNADASNIPEEVYGVLRVFGENTDVASSDSQWIFQEWRGTDGKVYNRHAINPDSLTPTNWSDWEQLLTGGEVVDISSAQTITGAKTFSSKITGTTSGNVIKSDLLDYVYPVGSIYMSVVNTSPASFLGGTWTALTNRFLVGAGGTYAVNGTGGSSTHTHTYGMRLGRYYGLMIGEGTTGTGAYKYTSSGTKSVSAFVNNDSDTITVTTSNVSTSTKSVSCGTQDSTGNTTYTSNIPPYLAVYMWKRTA